MTVPTYVPPVFRPPSEADSLIFQVTIGCSYNRCTFCSMYRSKRFRARPLGEVLAEIQRTRQILGDGDDVRRVFLGDGDAMCLSYRRLSQILDALNQTFPRLQRISAYANARDLLSKSHEELAELRARKLKLLYLGLESGDEQTLAAVDKGATVEQMIAAAQRARAAGIKLSVMVLIGLAGRARSLEHARASARVVSAMAPEFTSLLTYTPTEGSPLYEAFQRGEHVLPDPIGSLREIHEFVAAVTCSTYFTCTHASNYLPLRAWLPAHRDDLLAELSLAIAGQRRLKPEWLRGL